MSNIDNNNNSLLYILGFQILLCILKITGHINWSWGIILIPTWIMLAIVSVCLVILVLGCLVFVFKKQNPKTENKPNLKLYTEVKK